MYGISPEVPYLCSFKVSFSYEFCQSGQRYVSLHAIMVCKTGMKLSPNRWTL